MSTKFLIKKIDNEIKNSINRIEINQIVCTSNEAITKKWGIKEVEKHLRSGKHNRIDVNTAIFLNDLNNKSITTSEDERDALDKQIDKSFKVLSENFEKLIPFGENLYDLNECARSNIIKIDEAIASQNYDDWLKRKDPRNNLTTFFLLIKKNQIPFSEMSIDITSRCMHLIDFEFKYRRHKLQQLKNFLVDIYSKYLLLPNLEYLPTINYSCTQTDICELIISLTGVIETNNEYEKSKAILLSIFGITNIQYNNAMNQITKRKKEKSVFTLKLSENINKLPSKK